MKSLNLYSFFQTQRFKKNNPRDVQSRNDSSHKLIFAGEYPTCAGKQNEDQTRRNGRKELDKKIE